MVLVGVMVVQIVVIVFLLLLLVVVVIVPNLRAIALFLAALVLVHGVL